MGAPDEAVPFIAPLMEQLGAPLGSTVTAGESEAGPSAEEIQALISPVIASNALAQDCRLARLA